MKYARQADAAGSARTYVVVDSGHEHVVGYHAVAAARVEREAATARVIRLARDTCELDRDDEEPRDRRDIEDARRGRTISSWMVFEEEADAVGRRASEPRGCAMAGCRRLVTRS